MVLREGGQSPQGVDWKRQEGDACREAARGRIDRGFEGKVLMILMAILTLSLSLSISRSNQLPKVSSRKLWPINERLARCLAAAKWATAAAAAAAAAVVSGRKCLLATSE